jgi:hypothetical protein
LREGCQNPDSTLNRGFDTLHAPDPERERLEPESEPEKPDTMPEEEGGVTPPEPGTLPEELGRAGARAGSEST